MQDLIREAIEALEVLALDADEAGYFGLIGITCGSVHDEA